MAVSVVGAGLQCVSFSSAPGTPRFSVLTVGTALTWIIGGLSSGPLHRGWTNTSSPHRPVVAPVLWGTAAFAVFYGCARTARRIPALNAAISRVLRYAYQGNPRSVLATTLLSGAGEEIFFRGAVYRAAGTSHPVSVSTAVYVLATTATRNPALVLAAGVMGTLFGLQRRASGGIQAPILTHLTWSTLMVRFLPPLFPAPEA